MNREVVHLLRHIVYLPGRFEKHQGINLVLDGALIYEDLADKTLEVSPVYLEIGSNSYATEVYVAQIKDDIILGLNVIVDCGVVVN